MIRESFIKDLFIISFYEGSDNKTLKVIEEILNGFSNDIKKSKVKSLSALDELRLELIREVLDYRSKCNSFLLSDFLEIIKDGKFSDFIPEIEELIGNFNVDEFDSLLRRIDNASIFYRVKKDINGIKDRLEKIESGSFNRKDELINELKDFANKLLDKVSFSFNDVNYLNVLSELNFMDSDYNKLWDEIITNIFKKGVVQTGFNFLDQNLMMGGFESKRLYLIAGTSGIGKSLFLLNLMINAIKNNKDNLNSNKKSLYVYITGENLVDETFMRLYCCLFGVPSKKFFYEVWKIKRLGSEEDIINFLSEKRRQIQDFLNRKNSNILIKYFPANVTSIFEIRSYLNSIKEMGDLKCVYIDYLDLFDYPTMVSKELRLKLASITQEIKNIAIDFIVPVVTVTQLNRSGYLVEDITLANVSESIEKINKSDCVIFIQGFDSKSSKVLINNITYRKMKVIILKQRNGNVGESSLFYYKLYKNDEKKTSCFDYRLYEIIDKEDISNLDGGGGNGGVYGSGGDLWDL